MKKEDATPLKISLCWNGESVLNQNFCYPKACVPRVCPQRENHCKLEVLFLLERFREILTFQHFGSTILYLQSIRNSKGVGCLLHVNFFLPSVHDQEFFLPTVTIYFKHIGDGKKHFKPWETKFSLFGLTKCIELIMRINISKSQHCQWDARFS